MSEEFWRRVVYLQAIPERLHIASVTEVTYLWKTPFPVTVSNCSRSATDAATRYISCARLSSAISRLCPLLLRYHCRTECIRFIATYVELRLNVAVISCLNKARRRTYRDPRTQTTCVFPTSPCSSFFKNNSKTKTFHAAPNVLTYQCHPITNNFRQIIYNQLW